MRHIRRDIERTFNDEGLWVAILGTLSSPVGIHGANAELDLIESFLEEGIQGFCSGWVLIRISFVIVTQWVATVDCEYILHLHRLGPFKKLEQTKTVGVIVFY